MRWVIADLLESHERRQHDPAAFHSVAVLQSFPKLLHRLLVESDLLLREAAERAYLGLVREIGNHPLVALEPSKDVRTDQLAQRTIATVGALLGRPDEPAECLGRSQQARTG